MTNKVFEHLVFLTRCQGSREHLIEMLSDPGRAVAALEAEKKYLTGACRHIRNHLKCASPIRRTFDLFILSGILLGKETLRQRLELSRLTGIADEFSDPEFCVKRLMTAQWRQVPAILVNAHKQALLRYFLITTDIAADRSWPKWADHVMDEAAKTAMGNAADAVLNHLKGRIHFNGFYGFPLVPARQGLITGKSLGLPLALGLLQQIRNEPFKKEIIATGGIDPDGRVSGVSLSGKAPLAAKKGFSVFLYPRACTGPDRVEGLSAIAVSDLADAAMAYAPWVPEYREMIGLFMQMRKDPECLINNLACIPLSWMKWALHGDNLGTALRRVFCHQKYVDKLADRLEQELMDPDKPFSHKKLLARLVPADAIADICGKSPQAALRICGLQIMVANNRGDTQTAAQWRAAGDRMLNMARRVGSPDPILDYCNHCLITLHNAYRFSAEIPGWIMEILAIVEKQHETDRQLGREVHEALGRMYGTISQHCAFCGPGNFKQFEKYNHLAMKTLGAGIGQEFNRQEWKRQLSYWIYACLDAKKFKEAEISLANYLEINKIEDAPKHSDQFSQWQIAVLCRFLADTGPDHLLINLSHDLFSISGPTEPNEHPWQLIFWNLGRIALKTGDFVQATNFFRKSLKTCLTPINGPTVRAMGLLPLSGLLALSMPVDFREGWDKIRKIALELNPVHFQILKNNEPEQILKQIWSRPETLFPFSYR